MSHLRVVASGPLHHFSPNRPSHPFPIFAVIVDPPEVVLLWLRLR